MHSKTLIIALGVPAGLFKMLDGTTEGQVMYGNEVWHLTPDEYDQWNAVRLNPCPMDMATPRARKLLEDGALYLYDPITPDVIFMQHHRLAPMGHPIGPSSQSPGQYQIVSTNGRRVLVCDTAYAPIWLGWWHHRPLYQHSEAFSDQAVWDVIPWAVSQELGYLVRWEDR